MTAPPKAETAETAATAPLKVDLADLAVAQLVHDLRNQLMILAACSEQIFRLVPVGLAVADIAQVRESTDRASRLSRELLRAGRRKPRRPIDLNHVVAASVVGLQALTGENIGLRLRQARRPILVAAGPMELERILLNLALNARDAMSAGGVLTIETAITADPVPDRADVPGEWARLTVSDTGEGLPPDVRKRMFEPFFTTRASGTGLGLSSVAFTVQHLGGTISVDSQPGRGTSVTVLMPAAP